MADDDATPVPMDPALAAALTSLIAEIDKQPVPPRIRQLAERLEAALRAARGPTDDTATD